MQGYRGTREGPEFSLPSPGARGGGHTTNPGDVVANRDEELEEFRRTLEADLYDGLLTIKEACKVLAVSKGTFYRLVAKKRLVTVRIGNHAYVSREACARYIRERRAEADREPPTGRTARRPRAKPYPQPRVAGRLKSDATTAA